LVGDLGMLGVMLHQQPMMPITFYSSPPGVSKSMSQELMEEEITAFTLGMALHDPSTPEWTIYMPMAKSLVRAMDATQLAARELLPHVPWTIYMPMAKSLVLAPDATQLAARELLRHVPVSTAAAAVAASVVLLALQGGGLSCPHSLPLSLFKPSWPQPPDLCSLPPATHSAPLSLLSPQRVVAFISYGYDLINFQPNMQHLLDSLGAVPILGRFYVDYNLTRFLHTPQLRHILSYTDPYFFRERLTMPKLLIAASNDEFFLMDDSYFYFNDLPPPTLLKIVANVDHMVIQKSYW
ncbi:unnamed protein product, partial [Closterium sp. Naga37s-1]